MKQLDQSPRLTEFIKKLSAWLSRRRGAPIVLAVVLTAVSLVLHLLALLAPQSGLLLACAFTILHIGIIIGLIGILLIEPLGQG
jgi:hypothetical protein